MRLSIRYQLLLPLLTLMIGMAGMSAWTALSAAGRARRQIEGQMEHVAATLGSVTFPRNLQTLNLMKGLSGADFLLADAHRRPLRDDAGLPLTTLPALPDQLPVEPSGTNDHPLGERVRVAGHVYFLREVPLRQELGANLSVFVLYAESLWRDALWQSLWPGLFLGLAGGVVAVALTVVVTQQLTRRILDLERRTRLIAAGDFSPMPAPRRNDELRDLSQSVNDMAQQLARYQETIRQTERLRLLGQVSGGLAHQLRNGVTGARLAVQLHVRECPAKRDGAETTDEALDVALRQLSLVEMHLKRFLDLGKAGELQRQPCDVRQILRETLSLVGPQCRHAGLELRVASVDGPPLMVHGDRAQLDQLFLNVLTNAMEAAGPDGWVEVAAGPTADGQASVEVRDSGPGPPEQVAARLFEPFVTGKPEGVGLGLAVARQIVQAHGGTISWSRANDATHFIITLPAA